VHLGDLVLMVQHIVYNQMVVQLLQQVGGVVLVEQGIEKVINMVGEVMVKQLI